LPFWIRAIGLVALVLLGAGALLEMTVGTGFIFSRSNAYRAAMPWLFGFLSLVFAAGLLMLERANRSLLMRYPTWFVRWLIVFPLVVALTAVMAAIAPLGWAALLGQTFGSPSERLEVHVISVDSPSRNSSGCDHHATLEFEGNSARICMEGRLSGPAPQAGEKVAVAGRISRLGLFVDQIHRR
jgi:hypothetical protein